MTITLQPKASPGHHIIGLDSEHLNGGTVPWHKHLYADAEYEAALGSSWNLRCQRL